jgi:hypothetical protein
MLFGLEQTAIPGPAVVAEPGKKVHGFVHVDPLDNRYDVARTRIEYNLPVIVHALTFYRDFYSQNAQNTNKKSSLRFRQAAFLVNRTNCL